MNCGVCQQMAKADPRVGVDEAVTMIAGTLYCDRHVPDRQPRGNDVTGRPARPKAQPIELIDGDADGV